MKLLRNIGIIYYVLFASSLTGMQKPQTPLFAERGLISLPAEFQDKPVYYLHTPCIKGISCGYYTLNNALQLERRLQGKIAEPIEEFLNMCIRGLTIEKKLLDGTTFEQRKKIADKYSLAPIVQLKAVPQRTGFAIELTPDYVRITNPAGSPWIPRNALLNLHDAQDAFLEGYYDIIHFMGTLEVQGTPHVILLSVVRNADGSAALYIFDNCNVNPAEHPIMYAYIHYLLDNFISREPYSQMISGAIKNSNLSLLNYLLQKPAVLALIRDPQNTFLLNAFENYKNRLATINLLLLNNIFVPQNALSVATKDGLDFLCTSHDDKEIIKKLLQAGADPFAQTGNLGESLIKTLLKQSNSICLSTLETFFTPAQRAKLEELKKSYNPGFSIQKLLEAKKLFTRAGRNRELNLAYKDINSLEGLQQFEAKDWYNSLNLSGNYITHIPKDILNDFKRLKKLDFEGNQISSIDPLAFSQLNSLAELNLRYNELSYLDPVVIKNMIDNNIPVTVLDVSNNKLARENIEEIKKILPSSVTFKFEDQKEIPRQKIIRKIEPQKFIIPELETEEFQASGNK